MAGSNTLSTPAPSRTSTSSRASSVQSETPLKHNMSSTNVFIKGTLEEQKKAIRTDLGSIPEVTVDFMLEHIIPKSQVNVAATKESLVKKGIYTEALGWAQFRGKSPKELRKAPAKGRPKNKETEVFLNLKAVYEQIVSSTVLNDSATCSQTLCFEQYPNIAPVSSDGTKTRPDGVGILTKAQAIHSRHAFQDGNRVVPADEVEKPNWFDIAFVEEYKLDEKPADLNDVSCFRESLLLLTILIIEYLQNIMESAPYNAYRSSSPIHFWSYRRKSKYKDLVLLSTNSNCQSTI